MTDTTLCDDANTRCFPYNVPNSEISQNYEYFRDKQFTVIHFEEEKLRAL